MTHIHTTARTRGLLPAVLSPLSLSFSLAGRCVFALIFAAASPRPPSQLAQSLSRPPHKYSPCLSSPLSPRERADERTSERGARRAGGGGAVRLGVSSPLLPTLPFLRPPLDSRGSGFIEEMRELEKLRTETMMKSCQSTTSRAGAIRCPVPRKSGRSYKEYDLTQDLSDFIMSKASPPYFTGSPPVRASNPLVHDTQFCAWKLQNVDQSLSIPIPTKGCNVY
uniref:Uncharacterized protein n=1 Tax=Oryza rufipogon TaxID=4529 RepID=A0A0E0Q157_ORYRU